MIFLYYTVVINVISTIVMYYDKANARKHKRRVPEKTLFLLSLVWGSLGIFLGMYIFRHKTKHPSFVLGVPADFYNS
jgi:uncharacterized membrane protein YsdA (DUF1294 family)